MDRQHHDRRCETGEGFCRSRNRVHGLDRAIVVPRGFVNKAAGREHEARDRRP